MSNPFDVSGIEIGMDGIKRYTGLAPNLVHLLRGAAEEQADHDALVELGGARVTYQQLWIRASRVAGGLRAQGVGPGTASRTDCRTVTTGSTRSGARCSLAPCGAGQYPVR